MFNFLTPLPVTFFSDFFEKKFSQNCLFSLAVKELLRHIIVNFSVVAVNCYDYEIRRLILKEG